MKLGDLFKNNETTVDQKIMEAGVRLRALDKKYRVIIEKELRVIRYDKVNKHKDNLRAISKLKNAYYGLTIVNTSRERLSEITSTQELNKALNETGNILKLLNGIDGGSEKVKKFTLNYQLKKQDKAIAKEEGGISPVFKTPIDTLVEDDVVERLLGGQTLDDCLDGATGILCDMDEAIPFSEAFFSEMGQDDLNLGEETMSDINDLLSGL